MTKIDKNWKRDTKLAHLGLNPDAYFGIVNPPIARASTILYPNLAAYEDKNHKYRYGRVGNPMSDAFEGAVAELEGGYGAVVTQTGLSAIATAILSVIKSGDHILMTDSVYPNTHDMLKNICPKIGVEVEYYDPHIGSSIEKLVRDNTSLIYLECPGSGLYDMQDVPAITKVAKAKGIKTIADNTWAAGILFRPLEHGVNYVLQSATKYIGGHSDINLGFVVADSKENYKPLRQMAWDMGVTAAAEDMYLALRGLRSLTTRMKQNAAGALRVVEWIKDRPEIAQIYYPALPTHKGHEIWKRDFSGCNGLFTIRLQPADKQSVHDFIDSLKLFPVGSSWGGYESLCQPQYMDKVRHAVAWKEEGRVFRFQVGLEDPDDLIADLEQGLEKLK
jgi:cystathionine beta-lyase